MALGLLKLSKDSSGRWILRLDSSLLKSNCNRNIFLSAFRGLSEIRDSEAADYGTAGHKVMQWWYGYIEGFRPINAGVQCSKIPLPPKTVENAVAVGQEWFRANVKTTLNSWRTLAHFTKLMTSYFEEYRENDGLVADAGGLEQKFEHLWYEDDTVVVYLCGTKDFIGTYHGERVIVDHKTHTPYGIGGRDALIDAYLNSYRFSLQGKVYALHQMLEHNEDNIGFMVNGLFLEKSGKNSFKRSEVYRWSLKETTQFQDWLTYRMKEIVDSFKLFLKRQGDEDWHFLPNFTCCTEGKWPCQYIPLCSAQDDEHREQLVKLNFRTEERNPLRFQE